MEKKKSQGLSNLAGIQCAFVNFRIIMKEKYISSSSTAKEHTSQIIPLNKVRIAAKKRKYFKGQIS